MDLEIYKEINREYNFGVLCENGVILCDWLWDGHNKHFSDPMLEWTTYHVCLSNTKEDYKLVHKVKSKEEFIKWYTEKYFMYLL